MELKNEHSLVVKLKKVHSLLKNFQSSFLGVLEVMGKQNYIIMICEWNFNTIEKIDPSSPDDSFFIEKKMFLLKCVNFENFVYPLKWIP